MAYLSDECHCSKGKKETFMPKTLAPLTQEYLELLKTQNKSTKTIYTYGKDIEQILAFFGPDRAIDKITLPQVGKFYRSDELLTLPNGTKRAPRTVLKTVRVFRMFMTWAQAQGYIDTLPLPKALPIFQDKEDLSCEELVS